MSQSFLAKVGENYIPIPEEYVVDSLFSQYERVIVESLITSFGLDMFIKDQYGGDVDTIHNVRRISADSSSKMTYKNPDNAMAYSTHLALDSYDKKTKSIYDSAPQFIEARARAENLKDRGILTDAYTGKNVRRNANIDLDHVIATKEIHDDPGRILAGLSGLDLANSPENLQPTDRSINRSMKEKPISDYITWLETTKPVRDSRIQQLHQKEVLTDKEKSELYKLEKQNEIDISRMFESDLVARKAYDAKLAQAYYTSPRFAKDLSKAAGKLGAKMGLRQALGFIFSEIWFAVKAEFKQVSTKFDLGDFFSATARGVKKGFKNAQSKYKDLFKKFSEGALSGVFTSLTTTLCNIFFTTAKRTVTIIRQTWASVVQATEILLFNPDGLLFGERMRAASKILAIGASVVAGGLVRELIENTGVGSIPIVGDVLSTFCGTFVSGILSCSLLYFLDRSSLVNNLVAMLDRAPSISMEVNYFKQQALQLETYATQVLNIDSTKFERETEAYRIATAGLDETADEETLKSLLTQVFETLGLVLPWEGDFDNFMMQKECTLVFE